MGDILSGSRPLRSLVSTQYVLETDVPYLPSPSVRFSHSHYLGAVAKVVAKIRGVVLSGYRSLRVGIPKYKSLNEKEAGVNIPTCIYVGSPLAVKWNETSF